MHQTRLPLNHSLLEPVTSPCKELSYTLTNQARLVAGPRSRILILCQQTYPRTKVSPNVTLRVVCIQHSRRYSTTFGITITSRRGDRQFKCAGIKYASNCTECRCDFTWSNPSHPGAAFWPNASKTRHKADIYSSAVRNIGSPPHEKHGQCTFSN